MLNVFGAENLQITLSDGRKMSLGDLVKDYESLLKEKNSKTVIKPRLRVGEPFRINRDIIDKNEEKIYKECNIPDPGTKALWRRFEMINEIANKEPDRYPRLMDTFIFPHVWNCKTEQEMRDMCEERFDGMCDEIICGLELQMRICNGESAFALRYSIDELPHKRVIKLRDGDTGFFGGRPRTSEYDFGNLEIERSTAYLIKSEFAPCRKDYDNTPYAFRRVRS